MSFFAVVLILGGFGMIGISSKNTSQTLRQIGLGMVVAGFVILGLSRFNIPLFPG